MNTQTYQQMSLARNSTSSQNNTAILRAITSLVKTFAKAETLPIKYAKFGYDFPEMIKIKVMKLRDLNPNDPWIINLSDSLLRSLDSPCDLQDICGPFI